MSYRKRDFFKKTYLDFFMKLYQDKKAFANGKKKNYNKVLLRFFNRTCKPKATFYNYMKYSTKQEIVHISNDSNLSSTSTFDKSLKSTMNTSIKEESKIQKVKKFYDRIEKKLCF
jgi:hypothetical protein